VARTQSSSERDSLGSGTGGKSRRLLAGGAAPFYLAILAVVILVGISAVMVVSASSGEAVLRQTQDDSVPETTLPAFAEGINNLIFIVLGALAAFAISRLDYRLFAPLSFPVSLVVWGLLLATILVGQTILGSQRWLFIGPFSIQPSEFAKPALVMFLAYVLTYLEEARDNGDRTSDHAFRFVLLPGAIIVSSIVFIMMQPDLGTTFIILAGLLIVYLMSGYSVRFMGVIIPIGLVLFLVRAYTAGNYQALRLQGLVSGLLHGRYSHQVTQGLYALGSGGLFGVGPGLSRQKYFYLPEAQNDFILAIIGEELGLFGTLLVIAAFAMLMWAGFTIAQGAKDRMGRVIAAGVTTMIITQTIFNLFAVVGLGPVTGKPLPFVTLGGSAMLSSFIMLGLILSIARFGGEPRTGYEEHTSLFTRTSDRLLGLLKDVPSGTRERRSRPKRKPKRKRPERRRRDEEGGETDESDFELRWDSRTCVSSARTGPKTSISWS
jgi:cell division protein FtsW